MLGHRHILMSQVIGQVWREVVDCHNWPVMQVPQFIALWRNAPRTALAVDACQMGVQEDRGRV